MKKYSLFIVCLLLCSVLLCACQVKQKHQTIRYQRKLEKYLPTNNSGSLTTSTGAVDLSEGPRLKYDAKMGPNDVNFDIKIVNPYKF